MLKLIRKQQKVLLIIVAAIVIVAFAWLYDSTNYSQGQQGALTAFSVYNREYRASEAQRLMRTFDIAYQLGFYAFARTLFGENRQDRDRTDYAINLLILRKEAERLGITASEEEISEAIKSMPVFAPQGSYDPTRFQNFTNNVLLPNGFNPADLRQLVADNIAFEKIQNLLSANIQASPAEIEEQFEQSYSLIKTARVDFPKKADPDESKITEEEIKEHYEKNKQNLLSDPKRKISYVFFPTPEGLDELSAEERKEKISEHGAAVDNFFSALLVDGSEFDKTAKAQGLEVKRTQEFTAANPPQEFGEGAGQLIQEVFGRTLAAPISDPVRAANGFYIINLLAVVEPQPLSLEEVSSRIRETLAQTKAEDALRASAEAGRKAILADLDKGSTLEEAVKIAGFEFKDVPAFSRAEPPRDLPDSGVFASNAARLEPGDLVDVITGTDGAFLVYVESKELPTDEESLQRKEQLSEQISSLETRFLFQSWFNKVRSIADPRRPLGLQS